MLMKESILPVKVYMFTEKQKTTKQTTTSIKNRKAALTRFTLTDAELLRHIYTTILFGPTWSTSIAVSSKICI